jgi:predicted nucleic acid-binding protein
VTVDDRATVIVVDASAIVETLFGTSAGRSINDILFAPGEALCAPHLIDIEVTHVLRRFARDGDIASERCRLALDDFANLTISRHAHDFLLPRIWQLRNNLSAYDAAYVSLAEALDAPLVTCDRRLAKATGHNARIELV